MKKFFAFVIAMAMTVVANAGLVVSVTGNVVTFSSDAPVQELSLGLMDVDAGVLSVMSQNGNFIAGDAGFSGDTMNGEVGEVVYAPGALVAFARTTGKDKAVGEIASFLADGVSVITIMDDDILGIPATVTYADGSVESLNGMVVNVPEPMTMSLLGLGGLVAARRRRA